ncbi:MAG: glycoside hydrolase family 16 protein [Mucilaginibacter sp.]
MKYCYLIVLIAIGLFSGSCSKQADAGYTGSPLEPPVDKGWSFESTAAWSDEFDYTGSPDSTKWTYDLGGTGWGNNELEYYTKSLNNVSVANGLLTITARKESIGGMNYSSARMVSKGSGNLLYGRIEIKAKLPSGTGTWPAIWMLPNDYVYGNWPNSGEVDIMEMVGYDPNNVHFSAHNQTYFGGNSKTSTYNIPTSSTEFHLYREDWTPYAIRGYYDNNLVFTYTNNGMGAAFWPYDQKFHLLMNVAVGGNWGGIKGVDNTAFPTTMQVDYVRFYNMIAK